jgi:hypothetical protein
MRVLREQDFDRMATRVVDRYLSGRAKLADAAAAEALEAGLNPDQIERLTQSANTMTFLRMMEDRKAQGAGDLTQEFDPIDARQVIRIVIDDTGMHVDPGPSGCSEEEMPADAYALPDEMGPVRRPPPEVAPPPNGQLEDDQGKGGKPKAPSPKQAELAILRTRKLASVFEDQLCQAEWAFEDAFAKLAARFRWVYNDLPFEAFEKDALAEHGDEIGLSVLNLLREGRRLPPLDAKLAFAKTAALEGRHLSEDTPELELFETLVKIARGAAELERGLGLLRARCG